MGQNHTTDVICRGQSVPPSGTVTNELNTQGMDRLNIWVKYSQAITSGSAAVSMQLRYAMDDGGTDLVADTVADPVPGLPQPTPSSTDQSHVYFFDVPIARLGQKIFIDFTNADATNPVDELDLFADAH